MDAAVARKLGWKAGMAAVAVNVPYGFSCEWPAGCSGDLVLVFVRDASAMGAAVESAGRYRDGGRLWVAYPKATGSLSTDINRDRGWGPLKALGFLPVTQVALDADWSALRWRRRAEIRTLMRRSEVQPS